jgi:hypothetical protein
MGWGCSYERTAPASRRAFVCLIPHPPQKLALPVHQRVEGRLSEHRAMWRSETMVGLLVHDEMKVDGIVEMQPEPVC